MAEKCSIEGCEKEIAYVAQKVCQMHYFRFMRTGTYDLRKKNSKKRYVEPRSGYIRLLLPDHPLSSRGGIVAEHRAVLYAIHGENLPPCEICGAALEWNSCHVDHVDENTQNNDPKNLRALCRGCNTQRKYPDQKDLSGKIVLSFGGVEMTANEWARDPRVRITSQTIRRRKLLGMSDEDALFAPKITHVLTKAKKPAPRIVYDDPRDNQELKDLRAKHAEGQAS